MFCDLANSTQLSQFLDPEDLRELVCAYQESCAQVVERFGGTIAQYLGDGILVYFGYPSAHEDDALRAVRAGLGIVDAMGSLRRDARAKAPEELAVRIGIHTGRVVVGDVGGGTKRENLALGDTPNIAARLQGLAERNTITISPATHQLTRGFFETRSLGTHVLKGVAEPMEVRTVLQGERDPPPSRVDGERADSVGGERDRARGHAGGVGRRARGPRAGAPGHGGRRHREVAPRARDRGGGGKHLEHAAPGVLLAVLRQHRALPHPRARALERGVRAGGPEPGEAAEAAGIPRRHAHGPRRHGAPPGRRSCRSPPMPATCPRTCPPRRSGRRRSRPSRRSCSTRPRRSPRWS